MKNMKKKKQHVRPPKKDGSKLPEDLSLAVFCAVSALRAPGLRASGRLKLRVWQLLQDVPFLFWFFLGGLQVEGLGVVAPPVLEPVSGWHLHQ